MITIGIDPGAESGVAVFRGRELVHVEDVRKLREVDPWPRVRALQRAAYEAGLDIEPSGRIRGAYAVALEAQYAASFSASQRSAMKVAGHAAAWEAVAQVTSAEVAIVDRIYPSSWQALIGGATGNSKARKSRAKAAHLERWPDHEGLRQGAIDATWIALAAHLTRLGWSGNADEVLPGWEWVAELRRETMGDE